MLRTLPLRTALLLALTSALSLGGCDLFEGSPPSATGRVVDAQTGEPLADVGVSVMWDGADTLYPRSAGRSTTDADGRFEVSALSSSSGKRYFLRVRNGQSFDISAGYYLSFHAYAMHEESLSSGSNRVGTIQLDPMGVIHLRVQLSRRFRAREGVAVSVIPDDGSPTLRRVVSSTGPLTQSFVVGLPAGTGAQVVYDYYLDGESSTVAVGEVSVGRFEQTTVGIDLALPG